MEDAARRLPAWKIEAVHRPVPAAAVEAGLRAPLAPAGRPPIWTRDFALLVLGALLQSISFYFLIPALPLFVTGPLGLGEQAVGLVVGIFSVTAVVARPFGGYLLDRFGRRPVQLVAASCFTLTIFAYLLGDQLAGLLAARLLHGLSWGVVSVSSATVAADLIAPSRRGAGMSQYGLAVPVALALGPLLGAAVLDQIHFHRLFVASGLLGLAALISFALVRYPRLPCTGIRLTLDRVFEPRVLPLTLFMLLLCVGYGAFAAFIPLLARDAGFASPAAVFGSYALGALVTRLYGGAWYDRFGPLGPMLSGLGLLLGGWLCLGGWVRPAGLIVAGLLLGFGFGTVVPTFQAMAMDLVPADRRGAANGTLFSSYDIGITVGAMGAGALAPALGRPPLFFISAGLVAAAAVLLLVWVLPDFRQRRRVEGSGAAADAQ